MRLWHKNLIPLLPNDQLLGQWRECCAIASNLATYGEPHHILVNKIIQFPIDHFYTYAMVNVQNEFNKRKFFYTANAISNFENNLQTYSGRYYWSQIDHERLFEGWHSIRYLQQCILNLEEKRDCDGIELKDWFRIVNGVRNMSVLCEETFESLFI